MRITKLLSSLDLLKPIGTYRDRDMDDQQQTVPPGEMFLRLPDVIYKTGLSKTEIYRRMKVGRFPQARKLSTRLAVWTNSSIDRWIASQFDTDLDDLL